MTSTVSRRGTPTGIVRLDGAFARAALERRGALVPFVTAGDPSVPATAAVLAALVAAGVDAIELGIPYGDPLADGPTIAEAAHRALAGGTRIGDVLELIRVTAALPQAPPIVAFTYANPVVQYGLDRFARELAAAGGAGAIVPDLPIEESGIVRDAFAPLGLALPQLVAPTTGLDRAVALAEASDGFVYLVSRLGVTSARREPDIGWIAERIARLRARTRKPIAVGFGIATAEHVRAVVAHADGAIVGSALVEAIAGAATPAEAAARTRAFIEPLVLAARHGSVERA